MTTKAASARYVSAFKTALISATALGFMALPCWAEETKSTGDATIDSILNAPQNAYRGAVQLFAANDAPAKPVPYTSLKKGPAPIGVSLSSQETQLYQKAFAAIEAGDFAAADLAMAELSDKTLLGYLEFNKLFHTSYTASYEELISWIDRYPDHPQAMRAWNLAKRKKPAGLDDPAFPKAFSPAAQTLSANSRTATTPKTEVKPSTAGPDSNLTPKSARSAYNDGKLEQAIKLGVQIGDRWVAGLAAFRLKRFDEALTHFDFIVNDPSQNAWSQSGGAYWAGRVAERLNRKEDAELYFKVAASYPFTFYGLLAEERLGVEPAVIRAQKGLPPTYQEGSRGELTTTLHADFEWARANPQARRVSALLQLNRKGEARTELQAAVQRSPDQDTRNQWLALATAHDLSITKVKTSDRLFDPSNYAMPDFSPKGGYKVDKALLYAIAKKESKFNAKAKSYAGAYGLLQLMPATAGMMAKDTSLIKNPDQLLDPSVNLGIGQDYILRLLDTKIVNGDLLRAIASYNAGEKWVQDAVRSLGPDADSLLVMESIPVAQTRQYVEEVVASYWIYRHLMGKPSKTLAQAASDVKIINALDDR